MPLWLGYFANAATVWLPSVALGRTLNCFPLLAARAVVSSTIEATKARGRPSGWRSLITPHVIILFDFYPKLYAINTYSHTHIHMHTHPCRKLCHIG